jgi:hypothetical protein
VNQDLEKLISLHDLDVMIADLSRKEIRHQEEKLGLEADDAQEMLREMRTRGCSPSTTAWPATTATRWFPPSAEGAADA